MNKATFSIAEAENRIGYVFRDKRLLYTAFTHASYSHLSGDESNERLEFLGDAVLQLAVSEMLYERKPNLSEGEMTTLRQRYVAKPALERAADKLKIAELLIVNGTWQNVGKKAKSSLVESLIAAIYLDGNGANGKGYENAKSFICKNVEFSGEESYKNALQEFLQKQGEPPPVYETIDKSGEENAPTFTVKVTARNKSVFEQGETKREAEIAAAKKLLAILQQ